MVYYLSDPIYFGNDYTAWTNIGDSLSYVVSMKPSGYKLSSYSSYPWQEIYRGHISVLGGIQHIHLNDIIASAIDDRSYISPADPVRVDWPDQRPVKSMIESPSVLLDVKVELTGFDNHPTLTSTYQYKVLAYYKDAQTKRGEDIGDLTYTDSVRVYNLLQQRCSTLPRIPLLTKATDKFWVGALFAGNLAFWDHSTSDGDPQFMWWGRPKTLLYPLKLQNQNYVKFDSPGQVVASNLTGDDLRRVLSSQYTTHQITIQPVSQLSSDSGVIDTAMTIPVANVDQCPADYYLIWMDRTGAYQCQPFNKKVTRKENITSTEIINYRDEKRTVSKSITNEWTINSDWLTYQEYKDFESLFVSPYLYLYDVKNDEGHWVNISHKTWEDKTSSNTKKPFNLKLTLTANTPQNIIY